MAVSGLERATRAWRHHSGAWGAWRGSPRSRAVRPTAARSEGLHGRIRRRRLPPTRAGGSHETLAYYCVRKPRATDLPSFRGVRCIAPKITLPSWPSGAINAKTTGNKQH